MRILIGIRIQPNEKTHKFRAEANVTPRQILSALASNGLLNLYDPKNGRSIDYRVFLEQELPEFEIISDQQIGLFIQGLRGPGQIPSELDLIVSQATPTRGEKKTHAIIQISVASHWSVEELSRFLNLVKDYYETCLAFDVMVSDEHRALPRPYGRASLELDSIKAMIPPQDRLYIGRIMIQSPGNFEFIGKLNPLETVRKTIKSHHEHKRLTQQADHEREKDRSYRNDLERDRLAIENSLQALSVSERSAELSHKRSMSIIETQKATHLSAAEISARRLELERRRREIVLELDEHDRKMQSRAESRRLTRIRKQLELEQIKNSVIKEKIEIMKSAGIPAEIIASFVQSAFGNPAGQLASYIDQGKLVDANIISAFDADYEEIKVISTEESEVTSRIVEEAMPQWQSSKVAETEERATLELKKPD